MRPVQHAHVDRAAKGPALLSARPKWPEDTKSALTARSRPQACRSLLRTAPLSARCQSRGASARLQTPRLRQVQVRDGQGAGVRGAQGTRVRDPRQSDQGEGVALGGVRPSRKTILQPGCPRRRLCSPLRTPDGNESPQVGDVLQHVVLRQQSECADDSRVQLLRQVRRLHISQRVRDRRGRFGRTDGVRLLGDGLHEQYERHSSARLHFVRAVRRLHVAQPLEDAQEGRTRGRLPERDRSNPASAPKKAHRNTVLVLFGRTEVLS
jgi:hypothetical protein